MARKHKLPCPLGNDCPSGVEYHLAGSRVLKDHHKIASDNWKKQDNREKERNKQQEKPLNDFPEQQHDKRKDFHEGTHHTKAFINMVNETVENYDEVETAEIEEDTVHFNMWDGRRISYTKEYDGTYKVIEKNKEGKILKEDFADEEDLENVLPDLLTLGGVGAAGIAGGAALGHGYSKGRNNGKTGRQKEMHTGLGNVIRRWLKKYMKLFPGR